MQIDRFTYQGSVVLSLVPLLLLCVVLILTGLGCRQSGGSLEALNTSISSQIEVKLPPIHSLTREAASASDTLVGSQFALASSDTVVDGTDLLLSPPFKEMSFALYAFAADESDIVESVSFVVHDRVGSNTPVYLALSDYSKGSWQYLAPIAEDYGHVELESSVEQYTSKFGLIYLAVITYSGGDFALQSVEISFANRTEPMSSWPIGGHDNQRTGRSAQLVVESANVHFTTAVPGNFATSSPCIGADGTIYLGSYSLDDMGYLYAFAPDGSINWSYKALSPIYSSPAIGTDSTIYCGDDMKYLYALNRVGNKRWMFDADRQVRSSPLVGANGNIYFGTYGSNMMSVSPFGEELWNTDTTSGVKTGIAISDDGTTLFACTAGGDLAAVALDGTLLWLFDGEGEATGWPVVADDGNILYATESGNVYAVDSTGVEVEIFAPGGEFLSPPSLGHTGQVYIGNMNGMLYELDTSATLVDSYDVGAPLRSSPAIDGDGTLFFGAMDGRILAMNPDFSVQWEHQADDGFWSQPAIGDAGQLYIACKDGTLHAFAQNDPVPPATPTGLQASDGSYVGKIALDWDEGFDATGYKVYRDGAPDPIAEIGYMQYWEDTSIADTDIHSYQIAAVNEYGESNLSAADTGFAAATPPPAGWTGWRGNASRTNASVVQGPSVQPEETTIDYGSAQSPSPVACATDGTYYVKHGSWLYAYDPDGTEDWKYGIEYGDTSVPLITPDGNIIFYRDGGSIEAITAAGVYDWTYEPADTTQLMPSVVADDGTIYAFGDNSGSNLFHAINPDGTEKWTYASAHDTTYSFAAVGSDGTVYVPDHDNELIALDSAGNFKWSYLDSLAASSVPTINRDAGGDLIYINSNDGLVCLDDTGAEQWTFPATGYPALTTTGNLFLCANIRVYLINPDGTERDSVVNTNFSLIKQAVADAGNTIYLMASSKLYAYDVSLTEVWSKQSNGSFNKSYIAIGPNGRLFCNQNGGKLSIFSTPE